MTITLEKIKEMNIPLGTPIEIEKINNAEGIPFRKKPIPKILGYYAGLENSKPEDEPRVKLCPEKIENTSWTYFYSHLERYMPISEIKDLRILKQEE